MFLRKLTVFVLAAFILFFVGYVALCRYPLPIPTEWRQIHPGQLRREVLALHPDLKTELIDIKQLDQTWRFYDSPLFGRVSQYLIVHYDDWRPQNARVTGIEVKTLPTRFKGFRNENYVLVRN